MPLDPDRSVFEKYHLAEDNDNIIGITHVFSCINICRVPRKVFEYEAVRLSAQTSPEGPGKC